MHELMNELRSWKRQNERRMAELTMRTSATLTSLGETRVPSVAQAGGSLLLVLFGSVPDAHPQILSLVFDSMSIRKTLRCSGRWLPRICMRSTRTGPSCLTGHAACPACPLRPVVACSRH